MNSNEANITGGCMIYNLERLNQYTTSFPHYYAPLVIANWPNRPFTSIERLLFPFDDIIWLILIISVVFAMKIIFFILIYHHEQRHFFFGRGNTTPFLNVFNIILGGPVVMLPTRNFARTILTFWIIGTFILRSSYQGALYSFLKSNRPAQSIDTLEKLAEKNIPIYVPEIAKKPLSEGVPYLKNQ